MKTIYEFKKGDEIVRVEPAKPISNIFGVGVSDRSYLGEKVIFAGIANGQIYLQRTGVNNRIFDGKLIDLPIDIWDEGWDFYKDPRDIDEMECSIEFLENRMLEAAKKENYETAEKLRDVIKTLSNIKLQKK